jgi:hypothetical protein
MSSQSGGDGLVDNCKKSSRGGAAGCRVIPAWCWGCRWGQALARNVFFWLAMLRSSCRQDEAMGKSAKDIIADYLQKPPIMAKDLKPGEENGAGLVVYGQVSDIQRIVVDALTGYDTKKLYGFLGKCSLILDEADHVLVEQAENLLFIATPCHRTTHLRRFCTEFCCCLTLMKRSQRASSQHTVV